MAQKKTSKASSGSKKYNKTPKSNSRFYSDIYRIIQWLTPYAKSTGYWFGIPVFLYLVIFFLMQPEYVLNFPQAFFLDKGDGLQNVWNIWWVDKSLVNDSTSPFFTDLLHWPHGISLVPQTMNIFNGLIAIPLMHIFQFSLVEAVNFAVVFAFVFSGVTMFWFIQKLHKTYWVSLIAGALFTFSSYHFAHAQGHLQLVSFEFIPLFLLAFWTLLEKMRYRYALFAASSLFLVLLCDYYYLFWCVILGGLWFLWSLAAKEIRITSQAVKVLGLFAAVAIALVGPLVYALVRLTRQDPLMGSHNANQFSLDPLSVIMPGGSWYWHGLTDWYTVSMEYFAETSVFFGFGLLTLLSIVFIKQYIRKDTTIPSWLNFWWVILIVFGVLALGPHLRTLGGRTLEQVSLPYALVEKLFPTLQISGMPSRWILIALIAAIIIGSYLLSRMNLSGQRGKVLLGLFILVSLIDLWPRPLPLTSTRYQAYVNFLKDRPWGAVVDNGALSGTEQLYNQTLHGKPISFGYVTRTPKSVEEKDFHIFAAIEQGHIDTLCKEHQIRYFTTPLKRPLATAAPVIYKDARTLIYDLKDSPKC